MNYLKTYRHVIAIVIIVVLHVVGMVGIARDPNGMITALTPVNLWLCGGLVIGIHLWESRKDFWRFVVVFLGGFLVECLGVNSGFPFGEYIYQENFGVQLWNTPLVIGMNWLVLAYGSVGLWRRFTKGVMLWILTGITMLGVDFLIEPLAPVLSFWQFEEADVPVENFIAWAVLGGAAGLILSGTRAVRNPAAVVLLLIQILFFMVLGIIL